MISDALVFEGFDSRSWTNLISLFAPDVVSRLASEAATSDAPEVSEANGEAKPEGTLVVVLDDRERVLAAFHTRRGRIRGFTYEGPDGLARMCGRWGAARCMVLREGVLEEIGERLARRLERGEDYIAQWLVLARAVREVSEAGLLLTWPRPLGNVPIPTIGMVRRALDSVLPDESAMVLVVWQGNAPWTGLVLRRRRGAIDLIAGPDQIIRWTGPVGGDWRRDYRVISRAITESVAPVHLGVFTELSTLRGLLRSADPGAWARAAAVRDVIVHPAPPYVAVALGADAVRAVAARSAQMFGGLDAFEQLAPLAQYLRGRVAEVASVTATLGFDPLRLLAQWLRRAEGEPRPPARPDHEADHEADHEGSERAREEDDGHLDDPSPIR